MICQLLTTTLEERFALLQETIADGLRSPLTAQVVAVIESQNPSRMGAQIAALELVQALPIVGDVPGRDCVESVYKTLLNGGDCSSKSCVLIVLWLLIHRSAMRQHRAKGWAEMPIQLALVWEHSGGLVDHVRVDWSGQIVDPLRPLPIGARSPSWVPEWVKLDPVANPLAR